MVITASDVSVSVGGNIRWAALSTYVHGVDYTSVAVDALDADGCGELTFTGGTIVPNAVFTVGQKITLSNSEDVGNDGTYIVKALTATKITFFEPLSDDNATDTTMHLAGNDAGDGPYTVLELHRYLQDLADQAAASGDDLVDITSSNPSERSTDNIITLLGTYNIDDDMAEHLYDGSITQGAAGAVVYSGLVVVGSVYSATTILQVVQDNVLYDTDFPFWTTGMNADPAANILTRMLIKTRTASADVDGKRIRVTAREMGDTFAEFSVTMGLGNSVAAIFTNQDLNNPTAVATIAGWATITNVEGYQTIDLNNGDGAQPYYSQWNRDVRTINQLYERAKWLSRRGTAETLYGVDGELFRGITHQITYDTQTAVSFFSELDTLTWATGEGIIIADSEAGVNGGNTGTVWIQLTKGVAPLTDVAITDEHAVSANTDVITSRSLSPVFIGTSTGSAIIGAYGVGVEALDLSKNDLVFDLTNAPRAPPNVVTFYVYSVAIGDYVLVTNDDSGLDLNQLTLKTTLNGAAEEAVVCTASIPADTPGVGTIRIQLDTGLYRRIAYLSWATDTFVIAPTDFQATLAATQPRNVFISYIDKAAGATTESIQIKYSAGRTFFVRVRDGGATPIKSFETTGALTNAGGSATAIRTPDV